MSPGGSPAGPDDPNDASADSAGVPWAGRTLSAQPFAGDDGSAAAALVAALAAYRTGAGSLADVVRAWAPTRVMVAIVAVLGEGDDVRAAAELGQGDKSADMALITLTDRSGARALPVFSSTAAIAAWDASARPVPVEAARAAQAAVLEDCDRVLLDPPDPASAGVVLPRPAVWAVAQGRDWVPPAEDVEVLTGVANLLRAVPAVRAHRCEPDGPAGLVVVLGLPPGLAPDDLASVTARVGELLAADPVVAERATSVRLRLRPV
jgi:SseB protein N-terminal domain